MRPTHLALERPAGRFAPTGRSVRAPDLTHRTHRTDRTHRTHRTRHTHRTHRRPPPHAAIAIVASLLAGGLAVPPASPLLAQHADGAWPQSCLERTETIFDRVVHIEPELRPVPDVPRHEPALGLEGRHVDIGEVRLWIEEAGEGVPLLLLSGGPGTSHHYFHPHLLPASRFARLIYVDLRGVGRSDRDPEGVYTVDQAVADLEALRRALDIERWVPFGYSFGGTLAQVYTLRHPDRVAGLVLASSAVPMDVDVGLGVRQRDFMSEREVGRVAEIYRVDGEQVVPAHGDRVEPDRQARMVFNGFLNGDWKRRHLCRMSEDEIARYARYEWVHDRNYYFQMVDDARSLDLRGRFHDSRIPTLILEGRWDLAFGEWKPDILSEEFPRARLVLLEDAGHTLFEDAPADFFRALGEFVTDLESRGARPAGDTDEDGDPANDDAARGTEPAARRDARPPTHPHTRSPEKR